MVETIVDSDIYAACEQHFAKAREDANLARFVCGPHPIPFFGDVQAYSQSRLRILTASLNPSVSEFPDHVDRFNVDPAKGHLELEKGLSSYFKHAPYNWFRSFEQVLCGLDASYYPDKSEYRASTALDVSIALHIDICTPISTNPTWSKLPKSARTSLASEGAALLNRLVSALKPDVIIASVAQKQFRLAMPNLPPIGNWADCLIYTDTKEGKPLKSALRVKTFRETSGNPKLWVWGQTADIPFGRYSTERKREAGEAIMRMLKSS